MNGFGRVRSFFLKPWQEKILTLQFRFKPLWNRLCPSVPLPVRLPYGGWWLAGNDTVSNSISCGSFEEAEWQFVERFLKEGMTVLDIGAHHGFYTILASKKVGPAGRVIAFEPSPREERRLLLHLKLNHCNNVKVEPLALAGQDGDATFFIMEGRDTVFNSLRPPAVSRPTEKITVSTSTLDNYLKKERIHHVDFIKIDAEGAELEILKGAKSLFNQNSSPVIMIEVSDIRTEPWGYPASAIYDYLSDRCYRWFAVSPEGKLLQFRNQVDMYNFIAVPVEKLANFQEFIKTK